MTTNGFTRRDALTLLGAGIGAVTLPAGCGGAARARGAPGGDDAQVVTFLQLSDTHVGYHGPANPEADGTLARAVRAIEALDGRPDFVVFTGDLTHSTDDPAERRARMAAFKSTVGGLSVRERWFLPGEHDAAADGGEAFREAFGATRWSFDRRGVHFVGLDNVSLPGGVLGDEQLAWLERDLAQVDPRARVVAFARRPLFALYTEWDWLTKDGDRAVALLDRRPGGATVFYGHIHQEHTHVTGHVVHHAARSLMFALPSAGSAPKKAPLPWDAAAPFRGLGYRHVEEGATALERVVERPLDRV